ncbi:M14 family metallopeptidase [Gemmatimonadota bacterium]
MPRITREKVGSNVIRTLQCVVIVGILVPVLTISIQAQPFNVPITDPQVDLRFDRYHDYNAVGEAIDRMIEAFPKFLRLEIIGTSWEGRDMRCVVINNPDTGPDTAKTAFYVDGSIHGNEIQGIEVNLYLIWFLMENYDTLPKVRELVDTRAFYVVITQNPDGSQNWFEFANTGSSSRSGTRPLDSDNDGRYDEDGYDDLDGDGNIVEMRKYWPGKGTMKVSDIDPRLMISVEQGEVGDWIMLGSEGIDNDGDGRINEDGPGGYDLNRNWPADWQPDWIEGGAHWYPLSNPESRAVADFLLAHPNIAGAQSWHNFGGMILRGPGSSDRGEYSYRDRQALDYIGERAELILPYYDYIVLWEDLYSVHGGFIDYTFDNLGIFTFSNELWSSRQYYNEAWTDESPIPNEQRELFYNDAVGMGAWWVDWHEVDHPTFGRIEVGGWSKFYGRMTPPFMLQELCHRNAMFAIFHADQMPMVELGDIDIEQREGNTWRITATAINPRAIPTRADAARQNRIGLPDFFGIEGDDLTVHMGGLPSGMFGEQLTPVERRPERISIESGISGRDRVTVSWIVSGSGSVTITYESTKGGTVSRTVALR